MHIPYIILFVIPYILVISFYIIGWFRKPKPKTQIPLNNPFVSILVPVKDEAENLHLLLNDLMGQNYPSDKFEVILIDDHSQDETGSIIQEFQKQNNLVRSISLTEESGKKVALWKGIQHAKGELVLTTDGDCRISSEWVATMAGYFQKFPGQLLIGPVFMNERKGIFNHFQSLEFLSLIASGAGAAGIGRPILCNGANLGAPRDLFLKAKSIYISSIASGDDIFLLLELKKQHIPAVFVKEKEAVVSTKNSQHFGQFFKQRTRWTFKSRFYRDFDIIMVAVIVLFTNVFMLGMLFYSVLQPDMWLAFLSFYLLKCFVDYILLYNVAKFFNRSHLLRFFFIHQLMYIFYVSLVGIAGHFSGEQWKARKN